MSGSGERDYMNHNSMDDMDKAFKKAGQDIEAVMKEMTNVAKSMEGGALVGLGGDSFRAALEGPLKKRLNVLKAKMEELNKDINQAQAANREAERGAKGRFQ